MKSCVDQFRSGQLEVKFLHAERSRLLVVVVAEEGIAGARSGARAGVNGEHGHWH